MSRLPSVFSPCADSNKINHSPTMMGTFFFTTEKYTKDLFKWVFVQKRIVCPLPVDIHQIQADDNDGLLLFRSLKQCNSAVDICRVISKLEGCFAFVYFQVRIRTRLERKHSACMMIWSSLETKQLFVLWTWSVRSSEFIVLDQWWIPIHWRTAAGRFCSTEWSRTVFVTFPLDDQSKAMSLFSRSLNSKQICSIS